jgi:hypothetical protein
MIIAAFRVHEEWHFRGFENQAIYSGKPFEREKWAERFRFPVQPRVVKRGRVEMIDVVSERNTGFEVAGRQRFLAAVFRKPQQRLGFQHNSHDVSELACSGSFVGSRFLASVFGFSSAMTLEMTLAPTVSRGPLVDSARQASSAQAVGRFETSVNSLAAAPRNRSRDIRQAPFPIPGRGQAARPKIAVAL